MVDRLSSSESEYTLWTTFCSRLAHFSIAGLRCTARPRTRSMALRTSAAWSEWCVLKWDCTQGTETKSASSSQTPINASVDTICVTDAVSSTTPEPAHLKPRTVAAAAAAERTDKLYMMHNQLGQQSQHAAMNEEAARAFVIVNSW